MSDRYIFEELYKFGLNERDIRPYEKFILEEQYNWFFKALIKKTLKKTNGTYNKSNLTKKYILNILYNEFRINKFHENHISDVLGKIEFLKNNSTS